MEGASERAGPSNPSNALRIAVLLPVFNDWTPLSRLLSQLDETLDANGLSADAFVIDDGSYEWAPSDLGSVQRRSLTEIVMVRLRRNLGHQRAIAIGLALVAHKSRYSTVVVMDADGQDRAVDVPRLVERLRGQPLVKAVFAERLRRSESVLFTVLYHLYRGLHLALTGVRVKVGNFSVLSADALDTLVAMSELWNHYAAAVFRSRVPYATVPISRGARLSGGSRMDFVSLVAHGLSAISVFGEVVAVRLMVASLGLVTLGIMLSAMEASIGPPSVHAVGLGLTWGTVVLLLSSQALVASLLFAFLVLARRSSVGFLPLRDFHFFILEEHVAKKTP